MAIADDVSREQYIEMTHAQGQLSDRDLIFRLLILCQQRKY